MASPMDRVIAGQMLEPSVQAGLAAQEKMLKFEATEGASGKRTDRYIVHIQISKVKTYRPSPYLLKRVYVVSLICAGHTVNESTLDKGYTSLGTLEDRISWSTDPESGEKSVFHDVALRVHHSCSVWTGSGFDGVFLEGWGGSGEALELNRHFKYEVIFDEATCPKLYRELKDSGIQGRSADDLIAEKTGMPVQGFGGSQTVLAMDETGCEECCRIL